MRPVHLDFVQARRPVGFAGWAMLLVGIAAIASVVAVDILDWQPRAAVREEQLQALQTAIEARRPTAAKMDDKQLASEWAKAIAVSQELNLPWEKLFATFEAESERPVAVLALEPDAVKRELVVNGEAKNFEAMLGYYRMLQDQAIFSDVVLHTHQVNQQDREKPIRFRVTASWAAKS
jgi:Tfp pilus assembly protein PilN